MKPIEKGEKFTSENIKVIRPGFGLHPKYFKNFRKKSLKKKLKEGTKD